LLIACAVLLSAGAVGADEPTRQVQEELRRRNLYHGDIDGRQSPSLSAALKIYQERKGFPATGEIDGDTLRSMGITADNDAEGEALPNVPVLRSDRAVAPEGERDAASLIAMPPPVKGPPATREEITAFLRKYLDACQTPTVNDELEFYAPRVEYFHHGTVTRTYIRNELIAYNQQWSEREYAIDGPVQLKQQEFQTTASCRIKFNLRNREQNRAATGQAKNTFVLARGPDMSWEIVRHYEERVREAATTRRRSTRSKQTSEPPLRKIKRTFRKIFG
jgi:peptidoglycan hydrolase-like protein with peptidoglycan-binding domain